MPILTSLTAVPSNVLWEQGVIYVNSITPWAHGVGNGVRFEPNTEMVNIAEGIDGVSGPVAGCDVPVGGVATIAGSIVNVSDTILGQLAPGSSVVTATGTSTVTPQPYGTLLDVSTDYLAKVRAVWPLQGSTNFFIVKFEAAIITQWSVRSGGKGEKGVIDVTIAARTVAADVATGVVPWVMYLGANKDVGQS